MKMNVTVSQVLVLFVLGPIPFDFRTSNILNGSGF